MIKTKIEEGIYLLSMNVDQMNFESMWELPNGVTMNSYIVKGKEIAIIDGVIGWDGVPETLYESLGELGIDPKDIKYLIANHLEPDHAGWIENFKKIHDDFTLVTTAKGAEMAKVFYGDIVDCMIVKEGDSLDLGNGKILTFHPLPNVHWPETMVTYDTDSKILFSCDLYGAFGSIRDHYFDDEMNEQEVALYDLEVMRYFSNVMMTFSSFIKKAVTKTKTLDINMVAPGHGPLYRENPQKIMDFYWTLSEYANGFGKNEVTIIWGSMYGSTEKTVQHAMEILKREGVPVNSHQMPFALETDLMTDVLRSAGVIIAAPTYEYRMFPPVAHALDELGRKKMTGKNALFFGSYGWSAGAKKELESIMENYRMNWLFSDAIEFNGAPKEEAYQSIEEGVLQLIHNMKDKILE